MILYGYWRSSAAYRVRIALNLKGLAVEDEFVHLQKFDQRDDAYLALNPQGLVPTLVDGDVHFSQSMAIIEYLDERHPEPALLPDDLTGRARVRQLAQVVACDIHPINNLKVLNYLTQELGVSDDDRLKWYRHWVHQSFRGLEVLVSNSPATSKFCHGNQPTLADLCLVPQLYNARRFEVDLSAYPNLVRIDETCRAMDAFANAAPERQPDAS